MDFPSEDEFRALFQERLRRTQKELGKKHARMAFDLGIKEDAYKKYATRPGSNFPLYLLPRLIFVTDKPYSYWMGGTQTQPTMRLIKGRST